MKNGDLHYVNRHFFVSFVPIVAMVAEYLPPKADGQMPQARLLHFIPASLLAVL